jgi:hypothetical protein
MLCLCYSTTSDNGDFGSLMVINTTNINTAACTRNNACIGASNTTISTMINKSTMISTMMLRN